MKRNLKHITFSAMSAMIMASTVITTPMYSVSAIANPISTARVLPPSENGHRYTTDGGLVCDADSFALFVSNGESILGITGNGHGGSFTEIEKDLVTDEEVEKLYKDSGYGIYYAKDTNRIFCIKPDYSQTDYKNTFILSDTVIENPEIKYIFDGDSGMILDYKTNEVLHDFNKVDAAAFYLSPTRGYSNFVVYSQSSNVIMGSPEEIATNLCYVGDIDQSGIVDLTDLTTLSLHLVGDKEFTDDMLSISDMTNDGAVNLADLATMKQYIMNAL